MLINITNFLRCLPVLVASLLITSSLHAEPPVKIYILAGQSNMQGKGGIEGDGGNSLRSLVNAEATRQEFKSLVDEKGDWVVRDDVWIHYDLHPWKELRHGPLKPGYGSNGGQVGPELGFGQVMGDAIEGQVLLIKVAWGGKSLHHDFAPPSIGKYTGYPAIGEAGYYYTRLLEVVNLVTADIETFFPGYKGQGMEIAGFGWHQGWNDQYGDGNKENYERNMAAFIRDIRSVEHGLGVPNLPFVIATSGMIPADSPIVKGQIAMGDTKKYPDFAGNVSVVDTHKPYGPDKMEFKFDKDGKPTDKVGYHWNSSARSYLNIGRAMAAEMQKLDKPKLPSHLMATGKPDGVRLNWQLGSEKPESVEILRNGKKLEATLAPTQTQYTDGSALPGVNKYELVFSMPSGKQELIATCDTSPTEFEAYRSMEGAMLSWKAPGMYKGFRIKRDGKVIADKLAADVRSYEDKAAPAKGKVTYSVEPTTGKATPATLVVNRGPADSGGALVYEPFDYPADAGEAQLLTGMGGALGTKGSYVYLGEKNPERAPATVAKSIAYGGLPVTGNRGSTHRWSDGGYIELDDSLKKAGLLEDGATLWMSYVFIAETNANLDGRGSGGGCITLRSEDMQEGVGMRCDGRQYETVMVLNGKVERTRITSARGDEPTLVVIRITWGKDGEVDSIVPISVDPDLKIKGEGREFKPSANIDQTKLTRLVLSDEGQFDEIRIGPTFESVIGAGK